MTRGRVVSTQPLNVENWLRVVAQDLDPNGARYHHVKHIDSMYMEDDDYALLELADGSVYAAVYTDDGCRVRWTPL